MRCLVTGSSGFVGQALTRALRARGDDVRAMVRVALATKEPDTLVADVGDPNAICAAAVGCEVVFHCAGIAHANAAPRALEWVNVAGTENVINAAREAGVRRVVMVSCADVSLVDADRIHWGESRVITERPLDAHARTKLLAEEIALAASDQRLEVTALRPSWLWGPGDHTTLPQLCSESARGGVRLFGPGDNLLSTLYIDNLIDALIDAATAPQAPGRAYYVQDNEVLTAREFLTQLCQACALPPPRIGLTAWSKTTAWCSEHVRQRPGEFSRVVRRTRSTLFDVQAAVRDLKFAPRVSVNEGMSALSQWMRDQGGASTVAGRCRGFVAEASVDAQVRLAQP